ncbi:hypothetical protein, partial [Paracoccus yeei]|uniref:hypothetical protein n=1 Tax=Paracoccus yeei TaxID=147645 RepID=UPI001CD2B999
RVHPTLPHIRTCLTEGARQRITEDSSGARPFSGQKTFVGNCKTIMTITTLVESRQRMALCVPRTEVVRFV